MFRGPATTLLRISSSRKSASRFRIFTGNRLLHSVGQYDDHKILQSNPVRPFSTTVNQVWFRLLSQRSRFGVFSSFNLRRISIPVGPEADNKDGNGVSSSNVVEVGGYDADVGKNVCFENDSMMVTGEDGCIGDSICGSIVDDSKNGDSDLRSSKLRNYETIKSCDPVELYSELRSVEMGGSKRFMEAKKGIYCSPLRLLAMEVFDKVNAHGVYCSLLTGQEKKLLPFSSHIACTVEMVSTEDLYEIAVIDEIQMMSDPCRGYAWTRALLGLKADEIHLCGDPSVLNVVRKICSETGDELHEQHYERFKPLVVEAKTLLGDFKNVRSGDCIVAFSRREIFEVKLAIEKFTKHRCCVIYGSLPPETRRHQASLFNDQDNEFDVLVASDAVGMGLNLNIGRVVFYNLAKFNGDKIVPVPASQVKQIAGRAGRRGSRYPDGLTTTFCLDDLDYLIECLKQPFDEVKKIGLFPSFEQVELFAGQISKVAFAELLQKFSENCRLDGSYFLCRHDNIKKVANMLEKVSGLSLEDRYNFCFAPVNVRDPKAMYHLLRFASSYSHNVPVSIAMGMPKGSARSDSELLDLESKHQVLSMYLWLSQHFKEETFPYVKKVEVMATDIAKLLGQSLTKANWKPESRQAGKPKPRDKEGHENNKSPVWVQEKQVI